MDNYESKVTIFNFTTPWCSSCPYKISAQYNLDTYGICLCSDATPNNPNPICPWEDSWMSYTIDDDGNIIPSDNLADLQEIFQFQILLSNNRYFASRQNEKQVP